jgi:hypothetical protein
MGKNKRIGTFVFHRKQYNLSNTISMNEVNFSRTFHGYPSFLLATLALFFSAQSFAQVGKTEVTKWLFL